MSISTDLKARIRLSQAKSFARTLIGFRASAADIAAACEMTVERYPDVAADLLGQEILAERQRALHSANQTLNSAHIHARAAQAYEDLTGQRL